VTAIGFNAAEEIDRGGFGIVALHVDRETGQRIVVKHLFVGTNREQFNREVANLIKLDHPCVIRIVGWSDGHLPNWAQIHMELAPNRSLERAFKRAHPGYPPVFGSATEKAKLICGIVLGMRYVHSRGIIHRDLKPGNILLDENWRPKISDFGVSRPESAEGPATGDTGTIWYAAPEQFVEGAAHTRETDVFAFGYLLYEIITGKPVFAPPESRMGVVRRIRAHDLPTLPPSFGVLMPGLISRCWSLNRRLRPSFEAIFGEFEDCGFAILPDVDSDQVRAFVNEILDLENRITGQKT
jgi:serine/threonine protein kinase